jgi:hypothetical protein
VCVNSETATPYSVPNMTRRNETAAVFLQLAFSGLDGS